eukprot:COSAG05_NODE_11676_length_502_cov_1.404467_1_plen_158_part_01
MRTAALAVLLGCLGGARGQKFEVSLGAMNGVGAQAWEMQVAKLGAASGKYSTGMISECKKLGMKPVCDHPSYCGPAINDPDSVYLGQSSHLSYRPYRIHASYVPAGFSAIESKFLNLCVYVRNANGNYALCNIPTNSHGWKTPQQFNPGFVCARSMGF